MNKDEEVQWLPVIAKSLAVIALHKAELSDGEVADKAEFLEALGVPRSDVAAMIGSTPESLRVMLSTRKKKKKKTGGSRNGKKDRD